MRLASSLLIVALLPAAAPPGATPVRMSARVGDSRIVVEVRDLPEEEASLAVRTAIGAVAAAERALATDGTGGEIDRLNSAAGQGPLPIDGEIGRLLQSVLGFCVWSRGAHGPLGGRLYELWEQARLAPSGRALEVAIETARCQNLRLRPETGEASLSADSRLDLRHYAAGYAVDRAMHRLRELGATNAFIEYRSIWRASGPGPEGAGWQVVPPVLPGMIESLDPVWLRDRALAVVGIHREPLRIGDTSYAPFLDQRTGEPTSGTQGVMVASPLAVEAQTIATTMIVLGNRKGQLRLGGVAPSPSVLWLLGDGSGEPLLATYKWSELRRH